jgi:hypothetical protein
LTLVLSLTLVMEFRLVTCMLRADPMFGAGIAASGRSAVGRRALAMWLATPPACHPPKSSGPCNRNNPGVPQRDAPPPRDTRTPITRCLPRLFPLASDGRSL